MSLLIIIWIAITVILAPFLIYAAYVLSSDDEAESSYGNYQRPISWTDLEVE